MLSWRRNGGFEPEDEERLSVTADGAFRLWRTIGWSAIGQFAGHLSDDSLQHLHQAVADAGRAGTFEGSVPHGAATEIYDLGEVGDVEVFAVLGGSSDPDTGWQPLVDLIRDLVQGELLRSPVAAVTIDVADGATAAHLAHAGTEALVLDLSAVQVRATRLDAGDRFDQGWSATIAAGGDAVTAGPGWTLDLPLEHALQGGAGCKVQLRVLLGVHDGDSRRTAQLGATTTLP